MRLPVLKIGVHAPKYPLVQGGMGVRISASRLAGAVANAGGVGTIAAVALGQTSSYYNGKNYFKANKMALADELKLVRQISPDGIIAVNCMVAISDYDDMVRTSLDNGAQIIVSGAGLPLHLPDLTKDYPDVAIVPIVSSLKAARVIIRRWERYGRLPDGFVVEAPGAAGGHLGAKAENLDNPELKLEHVVPELVAYLKDDIQADIPVIAAGGIWDRSDMYRMFALGARGVQMGTRFVCTEECDADDAFKQVFLNANKDDVVIITSPVGLPGRAVRNPFLDVVAKGPPEGHRCVANCLKVCSFKKGKKQQGYCIATALANAQAGDVDIGLVFCGTNVYRCNKIVTVPEIFEDLFNN